MPAKMADEAEMLAAETAQAVLTDSVSVFVSVFLNLLIHLFDMKKILKI